MTRIHLMDTLISMTVIDKLWYIRIHTVVK